MKQKNVLAENLRRFKTKNLITEGPGDLLVIGQNKDLITKLLDPETPEEQKLQIGNQIKTNFEKPNMWGKSYTALERLEGAIESGENLAGLIKPFVPENPAPLNLTIAKNLLTSILGNVNITAILTTLAKVARQLGVDVIKNEV